MCAKKSDRSSNPDPEGQAAKGYYKHPLALVESNAIGEGTRIWAWAHVMEKVKVGRDCNIGEHCFLENGCSVGDRVTVKNGISIWELVTIEDDVFLGPNMTFTNAPNPRMGLRRALVPTLVRKGASIGAGCVIVCGNTLGRYCLVGAGSVVTKDVPDYALVYGNPARQHGWVCGCGMKVLIKGGGARCSCGKAYMLGEQGLRPADEEV